MMQMWNVAPLLDAASASKKKKAVVSGDVFKLKTKTAVVGHDKDINQVTVSPNDALIASASQDKTVKVCVRDRLQCLVVWIA